MTNPYLFTAISVRVSDPRSHGGKYYRPRFIHGREQLLGKRICRTATEAADYARSVLSRWRRLYDAAIVAMVEEPGG